MSEINYLEILLLRIGYKIIQKLTNKILKYLSFLLNFFKLIEFFF